jgi:hypothetical protein
MGSDEEAGSSAKSVTNRKRDASKWWESLASSQTKRVNCDTESIAAVEALSRLRAKITGREQEVGLAASCVP